MKETKFKIEIELGELFELECGGEDGPGGISKVSTLENMIVNKIAEKIESNIASQVNHRISSLINESVKKATDEALSKMVDGFMDTPIKVTDDYGREKFSGTIREKIIRNFQNFLGENVDNDGRSSSGYCAKMTRAEYFSKKILEGEMNSFVKNTVESVRKAVKEKLTEELQLAVGTEVVNSIGVKNVIDRLQIPMNTK